jgi:predicted phage replisome organizer
MADVKWIKLTTDMFDNRKIKHLRRLPDGNSIVLIWVMLLTMAGRCNANGMIFLTENIPYTPKMLADELDFEETTVQLALQALEEFNMIVTNGAYFAIAGWEEYQNIEGMEKIREQNRLRYKKWYDSQKALAEPNVRPNVRLTQPNATEEDKERDIKKKIIEEEIKEDPRHKYGEYKNVLLSDSDLEKLKTEYPSDYQERIENLSAYIASTGKSYKNHLATIRNWARKDKEKEQANSSGIAKSFDSGEFYKANVRKTYGRREPQMHKSSETPKTAADNAEVREKMNALKERLG